MINYLRLSSGIRDCGLAPRVRIKLVGVHDVAYGASETRFEYNAGQCQPGEPAVVPAGHAAHVHGRVGGQPAELELLTRGRGRGGRVVHRHGGDAAAAFHGHAVPTAVAQVVAGHQYLSAGAQVVPQAHGALHDLQFEKIVRPAIVGVHEQPVGRPRLELHF